MTEDKKRKAVYNREANRRWEEKNPEHRKYLSHRSRARSFVRSVATLEDLEELAAMIEKRQACFPLSLDANNNPVEE